MSPIGPALGSAPPLLVFLPGIIEQGAPTYLAATGQTQEPSSPGGCY